MKPDTTLAAHPSPTGTPVLPAWLAPYVAGLGILGMTLQPEVPEGTVWASACRVVVGVAITYGVLSPGWRR